MTNFTYNRDVPNPPNNPSQDVPKMKVNNNNIDDIFNIDHISFNQNNGGLHKQVQITQQAAIPPGLIANTGNIYVKSANSYSQIFYSNGTSGNQYQLTRVDDVNFASFGTQVLYGAPPAGVTQAGGWTFLPGGLLYQYGLFTKAAGIAASGNVQFPRAFTTAPYSLVMTLQTQNPDATTILTIDQSSLPTTTQFTYQISGSTTSRGIMWFAIGT